MLSDLGLLEAFIPHFILLFNFFPFFFCTLHPLPAIIPPLPPAHKAPLTPQPAFL